MQATRACFARETTRRRATHRHCRTAVRLLASAAMKGPPTDTPRTSSGADATSGRRAWSGRWVASLVAGLSIVMTSTSDARSEWRRTADIDWGTAYTLAEGSLSVGVLSPLIVGVTDEFHVSIHPILLLVGKPSLTLRYRVTPIGSVTVSVDVGGAWSFIRRVNLDGQEPAEGSTVATGFPGSLQATTNITFRVSPTWLFTVGTGGGLDFLGGSARRGLMEFHASAHWLPGPRHLVMLQASTLVDLTGSGGLVRPTVQAMYAWAAAPRVQLGVGLTVGRIVWETGPGQATNIYAFPILDAWFRF